MERVEGHGPSDTLHSGEVSSELSTGLRQSFPVSMPSSTPELLSAMCQTPPEEGMSSSSSPLSSVSSTHFDGMMPELGSLMPNLNPAAGLEAPMQPTRKNPSRAARGQGGHRPARLNSPAPKKLGRAKRLRADEKIPEPDSARPAKRTNRGDTTSTTKQFASSAPELSVNKRVGRPRKTASASVSSTIVVKHKKSPAAQISPKPSLIVKLKVRFTLQHQVVNNIQTVTVVPMDPPPQPDMTGVMSVEHQSTYREIPADLVALVRQLSIRVPLAQKPECKGSPQVWAEERQALCETLPYYLSHQGACYMLNGIVRSMMFDEVDDPRDFMDADVIVSRAGGGMARDSSGAMIQVKPQGENSQTRAMRHNLMHKTPIVIICGNRNSVCPSKMTHKYSVLGHFKVTDIVHRKGSKSSHAIVQYRFEKLNAAQEGWWAPVGSQPLVALGALAEPKRQLCSTCQQTHEQVFLVWMCLNPGCSSYWKLLDGSEPQEDEVAHFDPTWLKKHTKWDSEEDPFSLYPDPELINGDGELDIVLAHEEKRGLCCPKCGMCTARHLFRGFKCDNPVCDFEHYALPRPTPTSWLRERKKPVGYGIPLSYDIFAPHIAYEHEFKYSHHVNYFRIPGLDNNLIVHMISNERVLKEPKGPDEMFRSMQTTDLGLQRSFMAGGGK